jgi:hypothetical protein
MVNEWLFAPNLSKCFKTLSNALRPGCAMSPAYILPMMLPELNLALGADSAPGRCPERSERRQRRRPEPATAAGHWPWKSAESVRNGSK